MRGFCEPVEHGVRHGGVLGEHVVPVFDGELAGDDGRFQYTKLVRFFN